MQNYLSVHPWMMSGEYQSVISFPGYCGFDLSQFCLSLVENNENIQCIYNEQTGYHM